MFLWPLVNAEFHGVSSQTGRTNNAKNGVSLLSEEGRTAFSMSSDSYYGLAMQKPIQRNWKEFITAPKTASFRKAEQQVTPFDIKQLRGLLNSSVVVKHVHSNACRRRGGMAQ